MKFENKLEYIILILLLVAIVVILLYKYFHQRKTLEGFEDSPKQHVLVDVAQLSQEIKQIGNFINGGQSSMEEPTPSMSVEPTQTMTVEPTPSLTVEPTPTMSVEPTQTMSMETEPPTMLNSQTIEPTPITNTPFQTTPAPTTTHNLSLLDGLKTVHDNLTENGILKPSSTSPSTINTTVDLTVLSEKLAPLIEQGMSMYGVNYNHGMNNHGMNNHGMNNQGMDNQGMDNDNYGEHNFTMMNNGYSDPTMMMGNGLEQHNFSTINSDPTSNMINSRLDQNLDMLYSNSGEFNLEQPLTTFNEGQLHPSKCPEQKGVNNVFRPEINIITADRKYKHKL